MATKKVSSPRKLRASSSLPALNTSNVKASYQRAATRAKTLATACKDGKVRSTTTGRCVKPAGSAPKPRKAAAGMVQYTSAPRKVKGKDGVVRTVPATTRSANPALAKKPCAKPGFVRALAAPFRCLKSGGTTLRKLTTASGYCEDRTKTRKDGKLATVHYIPNPSQKKGARMCIKAGGAAAKAKLAGVQACGPTQVLKTYTRQMARVVGQPQEGTVQRTYTRCIKATGAAKPCPIGSFQAMKVIKGKTVHKCLKNPKMLEAAKITKKGTTTGGWTKTASGSIPAPVFKKASVGGYTAPFRMTKNMSMTRAQKPTKRTARAAPRAATPRAMSASPMAISPSRALKRTRSASPASASKRPRVTAPKMKKKAAPKKAPAAMAPRRSSRLAAKK
jgi:hypothetical protein